MKDNSMKPAEAYWTINVQTQGAHFAPVVAYDSGETAEPASLALAFSERR
jgi:hypothetical protein